MPIFQPLPPARRGRRLLAALSALLLLSGTAILPAHAATTSAVSAVVTSTGEEPKPTIVLVHGAFADASGWNAVTRRLQKAGYTVYATANPLRAIEGDAESLRLFLGEIDGPIVLVGHSYGGAVITNAATGNPNVKGLVYVAGYAPEEGETLAEINELGGGHSLVLEHLVVRPYPGAPPEDGDGYISADGFQLVFCADLPDRRAAVLAASQRPAALSTLVTPSGPPAWETIPSWYLIASQDNTIPPEAQRVMAARMGAETREITSSHVAMMSHPNATTRMILAAATS